MHQNVINRDSAYRGGSLALSDPPQIDPPMRSAPEKMRFISANISIGRKTSDDPYFG